MAETKKTVFFIVEGNTDKTALQNIFKKIYKHKNIRFEFTNGDVTSDDLIDENNVSDKLYLLVERYIIDNKLNKTDIWQIVHIFDTDGTYIPESSIVEGESNKFVYSTTNIACKSREKVIERNEKKSRMMEYLLTVGEIKSIPYRCYYMSSNLDHALYDEQNLSDDDKKEYADAFYSAFLNKEKKFIEFLETDVVNGVPNTFPSSWRYIKDGLHSLERHTNLHIYFKENPYE